MFRIGRLPFRVDTALSPLSAALASSSKKPHGQGTGLPHSGRLPFRLCLRRLQARSATAASPRKQANSKATSSRLRSKFMSGAFGKNSSIARFKVVAHLAHETKCISVTHQ